MSRDETECYRCHARLRGGSASLRRVFGGLIPSEMPIVTIALLLVNIGFFILTVQQTYDSGRGGQDRSFEPSGEILVRFGAAFKTLPIVVDGQPETLGGGQWWRLFAPIFLHGGLLHLIMNSLALWTAGQVVERMFGRSRMIVAYLAAGAIGFAPTVFYRDIALSVGASGAIFGLIGLCVAYSLRNRGRAASAMRQSFVPWLIYGVVFSFLPGIDWIAHLGGLVGGGAFGLLIADREVARRTPESIWIAAAAVAVALVPVSFYFAIQASPW